MRSLINGESFIAVSCVVSVLLIILGFNHFYSKGKFSSRINSKIESTKSALFNEKIKLTFETDDSIVVETKFGVSKFNSLAFSELFSFLSSDLVYGTIHALIALWRSELLI